MKTLVLLFGTLATGCFVDDGAHHNPGGGGGGGGGDGSGDVGVCGEENCSPKTPNGMQFAGAVPVNNYFPHGILSSIDNHIATTGTDNVQLRFTLENGEDADFTFDFDAESTIPSVLAIENVDGPNIALRGLGGLARLRILDPETGELYDRFKYESSPFARAVAVSADERFTGADFGSSQQFVFVPGDRRVGIAYQNATTEQNRLVDTSATLTLAGATQSGWDTIDIPAATVGHHTVAVHVGDADGTADVEVVAGPDEVKLLFSISNVVCFGAFAHDAFVSGLQWSFTIDGQAAGAEPAFGPNCVTSVLAGPFTVTATAAGKSVTFTSSGQ